MHTFVLVFAFVLFALSTVGLGGFAVYIDCRGKDAFLPVFLAIVSLVAAILLGGLLA